MPQLRAHRPDLEFKAYEASLEPVLDKVGISDALDKFQACLRGRDVLFVRIPSEGVGVAPPMHPVGPTVGDALLYRFVRSGRSWQPLMGLFAIAIVNLNRAMDDDDLSIVKTAGGPFD